MVFPSLTLVHQSLKLQFHLSDIVQYTMDLRDSGLLSGTDSPLKDTKGKLPLPFVLHYSLLETDVSLRLSEIFSRIDSLEGSLSV